MRRTVATLTTLALSAASVASVSHAEVCHSPRIKRAKSCGVVIDPYGMFVPNAKVTFGSAGSDSPVVTDAHGKFFAHTGGEEVHLSVSAPGFQSVETSIGKLKQAQASCKKPLYVMLTIGEQGCAMISTRKSDLLLAKKE